MICRQAASPSIRWAVTCPYSPKLMPLPLSQSGLTPLTYLAPSHMSPSLTTLKAYRAQHRHLYAEEDDFTEEDLSRNSLYYGPERSLYVLLNGEPIPPRAVIERGLEPMECAAWGSHEEREHLVAIDVTLGRLQLLHKQPPDANDIVEVNYCYGFSGDFGGGPYTRPSIPRSYTPVNVSRA